MTRTDGECVPLSCIYFPDSTSSDLTLYPILRASTSRPYVFYASTHPHRTGLAFRSRTSPTCLPASLPCLLLPTTHCLLLTAHCSSICYRSCYLSVCLIVCLYLYSMDLDLSIPHAIRLYIPLRLRLRVMFIDSPPGALLARRENCIFISSVRPLGYILTLCLQTVIIFAHLMCALVLTLPYSTRCSASIAASSRVLGACPMSPFNGNVKFTLSVDDFDSLITFTARRSTLQRRTILRTTSGSTTPTIVPIRPGLFSLDFKLLTLQRPWPRIRFL